MSTLHTWWTDRDAERYWLEVTDRKDLGANLKARRILIRCESEFLPQRTLEWTLEWTPGWTLGLPGPLASVAVSTWKTQVGGGYKQPAGINDRQDQRSECPWPVDQGGLRFPRMKCLYCGR